MDQASVLRHAGLGLPVRTPKDNLFQGSPGDAEGSTEQAIFWAISSDGGATWGRHVTLVPPDRGVPVWAPVLHVEVSSDFFNINSVTTSPRP